MTNDIKPLNLTSDAEVTPQTAVEPKKVTPQTAVEPKKVTPQTAVEPKKVDFQTAVEPKKVDFQTAEPKQPIQITGKSSKKKAMRMILVLVLLGVLSGFGLSRMGQGVKAPKKLKSSTEEGVEVGDIFGVQDEQAFRDEAEGEIVSGGIDGEGSHHLIREGGESQYVYLTSSIIDLDQFVDRKIRVWGETFEAQQAGWLMDVGRLQIL